MTAVTSRYRHIFIALAQKAWLRSQLSLWRLLVLALLPLPRLLFGSGALSSLPGELADLGLQRPLLLSDRGLERAGVVALVAPLLPPDTAYHLDVLENPSAVDADAGYAAYRKGACDGLIALGGGSVLDTGKMVAALACSPAGSALELLGKPGLIGLRAVPLVAVPTTAGTGSESSPVSALHLSPGGPVIGTRSPRLVPTLALCDPDLLRTLPPRLVAATGIDTLAHCLEGFLAEPANPIVDALALDGLERAYNNLEAAMRPSGEAARASLMSAAFAGGAAIHKGLGAVHAIAVSCGDQGLHHGSLVAAVLPSTIELVLGHLPEKAHRIASALGLASSSEIPGALRRLICTLGLPANLKEAAYRAPENASLLDSVCASPFNRSSPYVPTREEYAALLEDLLA